MTVSPAAANGSANGTAGAAPAPAPSPSASPSTETLVITPSQPFMRTSAKTVAAQLLGDLEGYSQIPNLAGQYLLLPTYPGVWGCVGQPAPRPSARAPAAGVRLVGPWRGALPPLPPPAGCQSCRRRCSVPPSPSARRGPAGGLHQTLQRVDAGSSQHGHPGWAGMQQDWRGLQARTERAGAHGGHALEATATRAPPPPPPDLPPCLPHPSRSAFRNAQGSSRCSMAPGSCLANQIYNIYYEGEWVAGWMGRRGGGSRAHARFGFTARLAPMRRLYTNPTAQRQRLPPALAGLAPPPSRSGPCGKGPGAPVLYWAVRRGARQHRPGWRHARPPPHTHTPRTHAAALPQSCRPPTSPLSACCTPPPLHSPQMSGEQRNGSLWLSLNLPLPFIKSSLVTLSVAADDVQLVVNRAPARILSAKVRAGCGGGVGWGGVDVCGWGRGAHSLLPGLTASCHVCRPAPRTPAPPSRCAPTT